MDKPNIIFILTDDQGIGDLGCLGNDLIQTPNIDKLHGESLSFTNFHVGPTCAPTRSGLLTGHYANSTGVWHTVGGRSLLRKSEWTLADAFSENGYKTGIFGKWHLGDEYPYRAMDRGFQRSVVHGAGGISQTPDWWGNDYFDDTYYTDGVPKPYKGYCTDVFFREALKFVDENKNNPFFCYIALNAPHAPFNVEDRYADLYRGKTEETISRFYGMITNIDENIGILRERLDELGIADNTIVIFMTDNGSAGGVKLDENSGLAVTGYNGGYRGKKNSEYEGGHRVPFIMNIPYKEDTRNKKIDRLCANIDFMPTLLDLCNINVLVEKTFHGRSLVDLIEGKSWEERVIVTDSQRLTEPVKWRKSAVMSDDWRLINGVELYNIKEDKEQQKDVAGDNPETLFWLRKEYEKWWDIVSEKFDEEIPIGIGNYETSFTPHDLRNKGADCPHHQGHIRAGYRVNGYYEVEVEEDGEYCFSLSRWPKHTGLSLTEGIVGSDIEFRKDCVMDEALHYYVGGEAIDIDKATVKLNNVCKRVEVDGEKNSIEIHMELKKGTGHLEAYFTELSGEDFAAYFIDVKKQK